MSRIFSAERIKFALMSMVMALSVSQAEAIQATNQANSCNGRKLIRGDTYCPSDENGQGGDFACVCVYPSGSHRVESGPVSDPADCEPCSGASGTLEPTPIIETGDGGSGGDLFSACGASKASFPGGSLICPPGCTGYIADVACLTDADGCAQWVWQETCSGSR